MRDYINSKIKVTVIIPCYNEEQYIGKCLESIINSNYNKKLIEVLVVDGMSKDNTRSIIGEFSKKYSYINLIDNQKQIIPSGMNIGIRRAKGDLIMKMDAHSEYPIDYINKCVTYQQKYDVDNVGGLVKVISNENNYFQKAIIKVISHRFGVGNSSFRIGINKPTFVDTVAYGCYKKDTLFNIGLYDEEIERSEDIVINNKIRKSGGKILIIPEIFILYHARTKLLKFIKHNFDNGLWSILPFKFGRKIYFSIRHYVPLFFVVYLVLLLLSIGKSYFIMAPLVLYSLLTFYFSTTISIKEKNIYYFFTMPAAFFTLHFSYGVGSLFGLIKIILPSKNRNIK